MFVGTFYHSLESKGRFSLPKAFRGRAANWVLTAGLDGCLFVFPKETFQAEASKYATLSYLKADHRALIRHLASNASWQKIDNLGRLTVNDNLKNYAGLTKQVVVVGALTRIELWSPERYHRFFNSLTENIEKTSEKIVM